MMQNIGQARLGLSSIWLCVGGANGGAIAIFLAAFYREQMPGENVVICVAIAAVLGCVAGMHLSYRATFDVSYSFYTIVYSTIVFGILLCGGATAFAIGQAGYPEFRWPGFCAHILCQLVTLLGGMYYEARALEWRRSDTSNRWRGKIEQFIDYSTHQVSPLLTSSLVKTSSTIKSPFWIIAIGTANIPLLFELYGHGKANVIFLAVPLLVGVTSYINIATFGPALFRLLLVRKLEKSSGCRFVNADYEKIQELRSGFFLARWLMKDYRLPQKPLTAPESSRNAANSAVKTRRKRRK